MAETGTIDIKLTSDDLLAEISDLKSFILLQSGGYLRNQILQTPEQIKTQSLKVAELTDSIEKLRLSIALSKNQALELVLNVMDAGKPKYSNDKARNLAVEQLLREDKLYLDNCDEIGRKDFALRVEQIHLEYLLNQFRAYLAIAGMQGVK